MKYVYSQIYKQTDLFVYSVCTDVFKSMLYLTKLLHIICKLYYICTVINKYF